MIVAALIGLYAGIMGGVCGANASAGFARNLRKAMYENIQQFSFSNIDRFSTAGLITRLTTDVTNVQNAYQMLLRMFVRAPISMVCAMIMSFYINAKLASIYLVAVIILGACLFFIISRVSGYFQEVFKKYDDLNASVQENIAGIRVVKAYVREDYEDKKFSKASYNVYKMFVKAEKILSYNAPLMQFAVYSCILGISWLGAKMIVTDQLTTGELMSLLTYCMNILMSLMMVSMVFVMVSMSVASAERITEVLEEKPELTNPERPVTEVKDGSIVFDHVNFSYKKGNGEYVLKDINLNIHAGETIGIIGGTGSAKSSLVNLISRLYDVTTGSIKVGGMDVRSYDMETLRNQVAVVLQKNVLFSGTILENLRWGNKEASKEECIRACQLACADEFIEKMPEGYETYLTADDIAKEADFFCFGTNDLTQMTFGFSRDDAGKFLNAYYDAKIYENDPFAKLDQNGVGKLMEMALELGKPVNPKLHCGICGEHGGDPTSVEFCNKIGLDYVSCSPFRVPIARLAAAQAAIAQKK